LPLDVLELVRTVGYLGIFAIIFAESGLFFAFFLPGDSLLFTAGFLASQGLIDFPILVAGCAVAAIAGNALGYAFGRHFGRPLFERPDSRWFKRRHLLAAEAFYEKHGGKTIIYAQFVPIIRTFAPFVAGVARMPYARFAMFNVIGSIGWVCSMTLLGYTMGNVEIVRKHFEKFVILIVLISVLPIILEVLKARRTKSHQ
jgi:membrane-associated protein